MFEFVASKAEKDAMARVGDSRAGCDHSPAHLFCTGSSRPLVEVSSGGSKQVSGVLPWGFHGA